MNLILLRAKTCIKDFTPILSISLLFSILVLNHLAIFWKAYGVVDITSFIKLIKYLLLGCLVICTIANLNIQLIRNKFVWLILVFLSIVSYKLVLLKSSNYSSDVFTYYFSNLTSIITYLLIGYTNPFKFKFRKYLLGIGWLMLSVNILFFTDFTTLSLDHSRLIYQGMRGNYLYYSDSFAMIAIMLIFSLKKISNQLIIFVYSIFSLMLFNSRAAIFCFFISCLIYFIIKALKLLSKKQFLTLIFMLLLSALGVVKFSPNKRMFNIKAAVSGNSMNERNQMFQHGLNDIFENPISGKIAGQLNFKKIPTLGSYMHNFISIWRQYGLLSFFIFLILLIKSIRDVWMQKINISIILFLFLLLEISYFRSFKYPYIWIFIGMMIAIDVYKSTEKELNS